MKNRIILLIALGLGLNVIAQKSRDVLQLQETIFVSDIKTTHLIFGEKIDYLDLGSPYFVADTLQTIIKVKHIGEDSGEPISQVTNLTVITESGDFYSIPLRFNRDVENLTYRLRKSKESIAAIRKEKVIKDEGELEIQKFVDRLQFAESNADLSNRREDFEIKVDGIYYQRDYMALRVTLYNTSTIDLDIDQILFRLKLKKKVSPDYIYQERLVKPIEVVDEVHKIKGFTSSTMVMIFKKFTPNENENLIIDVLEAGGGRSSKLKITRKKLLNPKTIRL